MSHVLLVGHSAMTAHNMARDLIESRGETIRVTEKKVDLPFIETDTSRYVFLPQFHVSEKERNLRGHKFNEVYFMGDFSASLVETLKSQLVNNTPNAQFYLVEPDATGFTFK